MKKLLLISFIVLISVSNLYSIDGHWKKVTKIPSISLETHWLDISFLKSDNKYGWICGMHGLILRTTNGGDSWSYANQSLKTHHLERIKFFDKDNGICAGTAKSNSQPGVYRSINGGNTWSDITPLDLITRWKNHLESSWSADFIDKNNGILCAGECTTDSLIFYRTIDGGINWTSYVQYCPKNRLCDVIMESNTGDCYAISSTVAWKSTDGGFTWDTLSTTGAVAHQEEICKSGNSILIPYSGSSCAGINERVGGMKFSSDGGLTWRAKEVRNNMFGVFLIDSRTGWAVGDNSSIYYTDNSGRDWEMLNCGINGYDIDDITFKNSGEGWAVGKNAVFKLSPSEKLMNKNKINFPGTCIGETAYDTVWVKNLSFNSTSINKTRIQSSLDIDIIEPTAANISIGSCDSIALVIRYKPKKTGKQIETWNITFAGGTTYQLLITAEPLESTATPETNLIVDTAYCNTKKITVLKWDVEQNLELLGKLVKVKGEKYIMAVTPLPLYLKTDRENEFEFTMSPPDTGWYSATFDITARPCDVIHQIEVKCYGVSSIIESIDRKSILAHCNATYYDTIPVANTGNYELRINRVQFSQPNDFLKIIGWVGEGTQTTIIKPGQEKKLAIMFVDGNDGNYNAILKLWNNDSTKVRGDRNPYNITINAYRSRTNINLENYIYDFGTICNHETYQKEIRIHNHGRKTADIIMPNENKNLYDFAMKTGGFPSILHPDSSVTMLMRFTPNITGNFLDTILIKTNPCGEIKKVIIKAKVIEGKLEHKPAILDTVVQAGFSFPMKLSLKNIGDIDLILQNMELDPPVVDLDFTITQPTNWKGLQLNAAGDGDETNFILTFFPHKEMEVNTCLRVSASGSCPLDTCIPIHFQIIDRLLILQEDSLNFEYIKCDSGDYTYDLHIYNAAMQVDTIETIYIEPINTPFSVNENLPIYINSHDTITVPITFSAAIEGNFNADVYVVTKMRNDRNQTLNVPIKVEFRTTKTSPTNRNFDDGIIDKCKGIVSHGISFTNMGTITDTLELMLIDPIHPVELKPKDYIIIPPNNTTILVANVDYQGYDLLGKKDIQIVANSIVCGASHTIQIKADLRKPILTPQPDSMYFDAWVGYSETKSLELKNKSGLELELIDISIGPKNADHSYSYDNSLVLQTGEHTNIDITYNARFEGDFIDTMFVTSKHQCEEIAKIILASHSPEEIYNIDLRMSRHKNIKMGDTVLVDLSLHSKVDYLISDIIDFQFTYNMDVLTPLNVYVRNQNNELKELNFSDKLGALHGRIDGDIARDIFTRSGSLMKINFQTLSNVPDTTKIIIEKFDPVPAKKIIWKKQHGFIHMADYCESAVVHSLIGVPTLSINKQHIINNELNIETSVSMRDIILHIDFIDVYGRIIDKKSVEAPIDTNDLTIDITNIPSGFYIIKYHTEYNQIILKKYIINK